MNTCSHACWSLIARVKGPIERQSKMQLFVGLKMSGAIIHKLTNIIVYICDPFLTVLVQKEYDFH